MGSFIVRRLIFAVFVVWGAITVIFVILRLVPGDPALLLAGPGATAADVAAMREDLGLDAPLLTQYGTFIADMATLDFGDSIWMGGPAISHVANRIPNSAVLALSGLGVAVLASFAVGVRAGRRPNGWFDKSTAVTSLVGQSLPNFWVGIMLVLVLSRSMQLLPSSGMGDWQSFVLPTLTLALPLFSVLVRLVRSGMVETITEGYIFTARSKGLTESVIERAHAFPNLLIPVVTVIGLQFGRLLGGAVIVETVFAWPGVGRLLVDAIGRRDYAVVEASVAFIALAFVVVNLVVDIAYGYLDPRVRVQ